MDDAVPGGKPDASLRDSRRRRGDHRRHRRRLAAPQLRPASQSIGVLDGATLVSYAEVFKGTYADATVHPEQRGRGIGTALARSTQARARADGGNLVGQPVPSGGDAEQLLESLGYRERWTSWVLQLPGVSVIEPQPLAPGYLIREMRVGDEKAGDQRAAYQLIEDAFDEWPDRQATTFCPRTHEPAPSVSTSGSVWSPPRPGVISGPPSDPPARRSRRPGRLH